MTAMPTVSHDSPGGAPDPEPKVHSHDTLGLQASSMAAQRRLEVKRLEAEVIEAALGAGWKVRRKRTFSTGRTRYAELVLRAKDSTTVVTLRTSDHAPGRPIGMRGDHAMIVVMVDVPGSVRLATGWLRRHSENMGCLPLVG